MNTRRTTRATRTSANQPSQSSVRALGDSMPTSSTFSVESLGLSNRGTGSLSPLSDTSDTPGTLMRTGETGDSANLPGATATAEHDSGDPPSADLATNSQPHAVSSVEDIASPKSSPESPPAIISDELPPASTASVTEGVATIADSGSGTGQVPDAAVHGDSQLALPGAGDTQSPATSSTISPTKRNLAQLDSAFSTHVTAITPSKKIRLNGGQLLVQNTPDDNSHSLLALGDTSPSQFPPSSRSVTSTPIAPLTPSPTRSITTLATLSGGDDIDDLQMDLPDEAALNSIPALRQAPLSSPIKLSSSRRPTVRQTWQEARSVVSAARLAAIDKIMRQSSSQPPQPFAFASTTSTNIPPFTGHTTGSSRPASPSPIRPAPPPFEELTFEEMMPVDIADSASDDIDAPFDDGGLGDSGCLSKYIMDPLLRQSYSNVQNRASAVLYPLTASASASNNSSWANLTRIYGDMSERSQRNLLTMLQFQLEGSWINPSRADPSTVLPQTVGKTIRLNPSGNQSYSAIFLTCGIVESSRIYNPVINKDRVVRQLDVRLFQQEAQLLVGFFGAVFRSSELTTSVSDGVVSFSTYPKLSTTGNDRDYSSAPIQRSSDPIDSRLPAFHHAPDTVAFRESIPIYNGTSTFEPSRKHLHAIAASAFPLYKGGKVDLPKGSVAVVGYTVTGYTPNVKHYRGVKNALSMNLQFVVALSVPTTVPAPIFSKPSGRSSTALDLPASSTSAAILDVSPGSSNDERAKVDVKNENLVFYEDLYPKRSHRA